MFLSRAPCPLLFAPTRILIGIPSASTFVPINLGSQFTPLPSPCLPISSIHKSTLVKHYPLFSPSRHRPTPPANLWIYYMGTVSEPTSLSAIHPSLISHPTEYLLFTIRTSPFPHSDLSQYPIHLPRLDPSYTSANCPTFFSL